MYNISIDSIFPAESIDANLDWILLENTKGEKKNIKKKVMESWHAITATKRMKTSTEKEIICKPQTTCEMRMKESN